MLNRKILVTEAKRLGLPAQGKSIYLAKKIEIINTDPRLWSLEEFKVILPHLAIHQDLRPGALDRVESIMTIGLLHGMVDSLYNMFTGQSWTFAACLKGVPAYIFVNGALKFKSKNNPYLRSGNIPLFAIFPTKFGAEIFDAIKNTAIINT